MSERLLKLGLPKYFGHAKNFESVVCDVGYMPAQIDAAIKWGAEFNGKLADLLPIVTRKTSEANRAAR